jgi:hypothetical protein
VDLNLDTLKREIQEFLDSAGFAVFRHSPGSLEGLSMVLWDVENHPDFQMFLNVAQKSGINMVLFATNEFAFSDVEELLEQLEEVDMSREEQRDYKSRLRELSIFEGVTCGIELAFDYNNRFYVYEVQPDWYEEYLGIEDEIVSRISDDLDDEDDSLGGYFSKN